MKVKIHGGSGGRGRAGDTHAAGGVRAGRGRGGSPAGSAGCAVPGPCPCGAGRSLAGRGASPVPLRSFCACADPAAAPLCRCRRRAVPHPPLPPAGSRSEGAQPSRHPLLLLPVKNPFSSNTSAIPNIDFESSDGKLFQVKLPLLMAAHTSAQSSCTLNFPYVAALCGCSLPCSEGLQFSLSVLCFHRATPGKFFPLAGTKPCCGKAWMDFFFLQLAPSSRFTPERSVLSISSFHFQKGLA